jgi:hypothetical protein
VILEVCIVVILVLAACELQRRVRRSLFLRNMKKRKPKRRIRMVYLHLVPVWMQYGIAYKGQSMDEFSEEIATALKLPKEEIYHFVELLYHARFGPDTITEEQLQEFGKTYSIIRRRLYDDAKWTRKLYYMYIMVL